MTTIDVSHNQNIASVTSVASHPLSHSSADLFRSKNMNSVSDLVQTFLVEHHRELEHQLMTSESQSERMEIDRDLTRVERAIAELEPT